MRTLICSPPHGPDPAGWAGPVLGNSMPITTSTNTPTSDFTPRSGTESHAPGIRPVLTLRNPKSGQESGDANGGQARGQRTHKNGLWQAGNEDACQHDKAA